MADARRTKARGKESPHFEAAASKVAFRHKIARCPPPQTTSTHCDIKTRCLPLQTQRKTAAPKPWQARNGRKGRRHSRPECTLQHRLQTPKKRFTLKMQWGADPASEIQHCPHGIPIADKAHSDILSKIEGHFSDFWQKLTRLLLQPSLPHKEAYLPKSSPPKHLRRSVPSLKMAPKTSPKRTQAGPQPRPKKLNSATHKSRTPTYRSIGDVRQWAPALRDCVVSPAGIG
ncbi:Hypothetical predicted protein [Pelobates cultripes]|uniref:Uncharacterized protein n=1 Tax=Pelobates cultripes TaxID=61616 RepID=A0AAD1T567_PELCU|nr:Hypothetical predicted protein [Pelobates cultripes]